MEMAKTQTSVPHMEELQQSLLLLSLPPSTLNCFMLSVLQQPCQAGIPVAVFQMSKRVQIKEVTWQSHTDQKGEVKN